MADLISLDRAKAQLPNADGTDDTTIALVVTACSGVIENFCRRKFSRQTWDELQYGTGTPYLYVNNPPIQSIASIRTGQLPALYLQYNDPLNQTEAATVQVSETAVTLIRTYAGTTTTNTFSFSSYPLVQDLVNGVNALNTSWKATISNQFALWQTSDFVHQLGSYGARNMSVPLCVYWQSLPYFKWDADKGEIWTPGGFVRGYQNYRVTYVGGYDEVPEPVQQACAELVQATYATIRENPLMLSETLDKYSYTKFADMNLKAVLSPASYQALTQYKVYRIARYK